MGRAFFIGLLSLMVAVGGFAETAPRAKSLPKTAEEIQRYLKNAQDQTAQIIEQMIEAAKEEEISGKMLGPWNRLSNEIVGHFRVLSYISGNNTEQQAEAIAGMEKFKRFLYDTVVQNKELYDSLMSYVQKASQKIDSLSPYEREGVYSLLDSFSGVGFQEKIVALKSFFSGKERNPFIYLEESKDSHIASDDQELSVLTLNTCFIPDGFPYLYGGATLPWQERVKPLAQEVIKTNADVVCLQEVFSEDAFYQIHNELKEEYSYFYGLIGPRFLGLSFQSLGMPSGLFIASKYPLENAQFTLFEERGYPVNQGFFDFVVRKNSQTVAHIYATHMQPLDEEAFTKIRLHQSKQLVEKMQKDFAEEKEEMPFFLCGDLNIPMDSKEPARDFLKSRFYSDYNKERAPTDVSNSTCTYYFTNYLLAQDKDPVEIDPHFQILDYALLLRASEEKFFLTTSRVLMNDLSEPDSALSDHHGLLSSIQKK